MKYSFNFCHGSRTVGFGTSAIIVKTLPPARLPLVVAHGASSGPDRGQLRRLAEPTITLAGKRIPGLRLDHPRQLALMHALVRFAHIAAGSNFTTSEIHPYVLAALQISSDHYTLAS